jgi:hypothetical protein
MLHGFGDLPTHALHNVVAVPLITGAEPPLLPAALSFPSKLSDGTPMTVSVSLRESCLKQTARSLSAAISR